MPVGGGLEETSGSLKRVDVFLVSRVNAADKLTFGAVYVKGMARAARGAP